MRIIVSLVLFALLVTACGTEPAERAKPRGGDDQELALKFAQCMRDNGVPEFSDPKFGDNGEQELSLPDGVDKAKVDAAQEKCKQYLPNGGEPQPADPEAIEQTRKFAQCMRENGVPKFPDPDENGGIAIEAGPGLDPMSPEFKAAEKKCDKYRGSGGSTHQEGGK